MLNQLFYKTLVWINLNYFIFTIGLFDFTNLKASTKQTFYFSIMYAITKLTLRETPAIQ